MDPDRASLSAARAIAVLVPVGLPRAVLRVSARDDPRRGAWRRRPADRRPRLGGDAAGALVHRLAGGRLDRADAAPWPPARVGSRPLRLPGRSLTRALVLVPFVLPTVVVATAFLELLPAGHERGVAAILAAHVFFNVAVVVRVVGAGGGGSIPRVWDAAATLGAGPAARLRTVTLPLLRPALASAAALVFLFSFTSFGVVLILGGPGYATLETEIYTQAARLFDLRAAAALSLLQLGAIAIVLGVTGAIERRAAVVVPVAPEHESCDGRAATSDSPSQACWGRRCRARAAAGGARRALARDAGRLRARLLPAARRGDGDAPRPTVASGLELARLRRRRDRDRARRRRARGRP